jgi:ribosomal protein L34E
MTYDYKLLDHYNNQSEGLPICQKAFQLIYGISSTKLKKLHRQLKTGKVHSREYTDRTALDKSILKSLATEKHLVKKADGSIG